MGWKGTSHSLWLKPLPATTLPEIFFYSQVCDFFFNYFFFPQFCCEFCSLSSDLNVLATLMPVCERIQAAESLKPPCFTDNLLSL